MTSLYRKWLIFNISLGTHLGVVGGIIRDRAVNRLKELEERT
jgi:hypothetical protein